MCIRDSYSPKQLESDHKARGFLRAGYNFYIRKSGEVVNLRPLEQIPALSLIHIYPGKVPRVSSN